MNYLEILLGLSLTMLLCSPCQAWGDEDQQIDTGFLDSAPGIDNFFEPVEPSWKQSIRLDDTSESPLRETYKDYIIRGVPYGSFRSLRLRKLKPLGGLKQKRYMGMEIPEYITKSDGTRVETSQRGTKQKMLNSG